jgi:hypothetical protein
MRLRQAVGAQQVPSSAASLPCVYCQMAHYWQLAICPAIQACCSTHRPLHVSNSLPEYATTPAPPASATSAWPTPTTPTLHATAERAQGCSKACAFDTQRGIWRNPGVRNTARRKWFSSCALLHASSRHYDGMHACCTLLYVSSMNSPSPH